MTTKNVKVGFPMGLKVNDDELINGLTLEELVDILTTYHGGSYVIGHDTKYCQKPHYHIHFFSVKDTSDGAMKTFRSDKIKKKFPHISKALRFYTGQDLKDANPNSWIGYAIKETQIKVSGLTITDEILIEAKTQLNIKMLKDIHSQKKEIEDKEKKDFRTKIMTYIRDKYNDYVREKFPDDFKSGIFEYRYVRLLLIKFLREEGKYGTLKKHYLDQYALQFMCEYDNWTEVDIEKFIYK